MSDKFSFNYKAPTENERRVIEDIKKQYEPRESCGSLERLKKLNARVHKPPKITGISLGVAGTLVLGTGMAMSIEWNMLLWGVIAGLAGIAVLACAYPVYKLLLKRNKKKYGAQIVKLSNELLNK